MPSSKIGADGHFARADLHMGKARTIRQVEHGSKEGEKRWAGSPNSLANLSERYEHGETDSRVADVGSGTSIFDPVLCELVYRWFCPPGGVVLDPFAGGSVRGVVAAMLGRSYVGVELRAEQIAANEAQARSICPGASVRWIEGDARDVVNLWPEGQADLVFSCPPYADLERYSDDPRDLSTMPWAAFLETYRAIIAVSVARLREDRFACFVVGDVRAPDGFYRGLPYETALAFTEVGARLYNEAVLVTAVGSLPIRAGRTFEATRKLGRTHQAVLVFCKGDPRRATEAVGPVEFGELQAATS